MVSLIQFILILIILFLTICFLHFSNRKKHPPGPIGFPILGMIPFSLIEALFSKWLGKKTEIEKFKQYKEKYGDIWSIEFGNQKVIVLSSWEVMNEAFVVNSKLFSGRPTSEAYKLISHGRGIIFNDGEMWRDHRKLAIKSLKELGMGTRNLEKRICEEGDNLISHLKTLTHQNINLFDILTKAVSNVVSRLVFDEHNRFDDEKFMKYVTSLRTITQSSTLENKISIHPKLFQMSFMQKIFPDVGIYFRDLDYFYNYIKKKCLLRLKINIENENSMPNCLFDYFYKYRFNDSSSLSVEERQEEIIQSMFDLYGGGIDTSCNLLSFACLILGKYQEVQNELRNEIKMLIKHDEDITSDLKRKCPKMLSFLNEVQRFCFLLTKIVRRVLTKCTFHGYLFHPNDVIFGDLATLFFDPVYFKDPNVFNPYRFMNESRTEYCPSKFLIPFGIGKRLCLGEGIATLEFFIFLEKIITKFNISLPEETFNNFEEIMKGQSGITHGPLNHYMKLELI